MIKSIQMQEEKIVKLPDKIASLIAAGEVIIRPESVIKELIENSIDSQATKIDLWLENGGKSLIIVKDDGNGMGYENLKMCIQNHATSKVSDNLYDINTFGFRGEALSSITSIAKVCISSRHKNSNNAYRITVDYDKKHTMQTIMLDKGTKIQVQDLFFSLPARLKFLKSNKVEAEHCVNTIKKIALANPQISFSCHVDQKEVFKTTKVTSDDIKIQLTNKAKDIFGKCIDNCIFIQEKNEDMSVYGLISSPIHARSTRDMQLFFVNKRPVKDMLFHAALKIGYSDLLAPNKHPIAIIFIQINNYLIDVNVHPSKSQIHFRDQNATRFLIVAAIKNALHNNANLFDRTIDQPKYEVETSSANINAYQNINEHTITENIKKNVEHKTQHNNSSYTFAPKTLFADSATQTQFRYNKNLQNIKKALFDIKPSVNSDVNATDKKEEIKYPLGAACMQINETFILSITQDSIFFIDQHAAHERIVYEDMKSIIREKRFVTSQKLLYPITVKTNNEEEFDALEKNVHVLKQVGIEYEITKANEIKVFFIPQIIANKNIDELMHNIAQDLLNIQSNQSIVDSIDYILKTISCHNSIRAGKKLTIEEMNILLRKIESVKYSDLCNHGRPTYVKFSFSQIGKWFDR